ncbi:MAG: DUF4837 family protein [Rikenellaceae bacterium]
MKRVQRVGMAIIAAIALIGCDALHTAADTKLTAQGSPYELIVVSDQAQWDGELGETMRDVFTASIPYLQQTEPLFDVLRVTERGFNNLVTRHRNIFKTEVLPTLDSTSVVVQYDLNAAPQIVMTLRGPSEESLNEYLSENSGMVVRALEMAERDRMISYAQKFGATNVESLIRKKFGFDMKVPKGYTVRNEGADFLWFSYEYPTASQGVLIYSYPATEGTLSLTQERLWQARNAYTSYIPGPSEGSYMTTYNDYEPEYRFFSLEGRHWAELRGLWNVAGDYMGGPFVSYSTIDEATNMVITIDCYVFSPKLGKRNFIRGVENLIYNVSFPAKAE